MIFLFVFHNTPCDNFIYYFWGIKCFGAFFLEAEELKCPIIAAMAHIFNSYNAQTLLCFLVVLLNQRQGSLYEQVELDLNRLKFNKEFIIQYKFTVQFSPIKLCISIIIEDVSLISRDIKW